VLRLGWLLGVKYAHPGQNGYGENGQDIGQSGHGDAGIDQRFRD
jgi:hypothetical protein